MFFLLRPTEERIRAILARQQTAEFSYTEVGASRGPDPPGYASLHNRVELGRGSVAFAQASEAMQQWKMFDFAGVWLYWPNVPLQPGNAVAVLLGHFGFWSLNLCRIVYAIDEDGPVRRFGFAYGTLAEHAECGEERFIVEWDRASDVVYYEISSFSRPGNWMTQITYPIARRLQRRFARNSLTAMAHAVRASGQIAKQRDPLPEVRDGT
jgi:uncharacterized protein (UPF0548 family)